MGNNNSLESFAYNNVEDVPLGQSPPPINQLIEKSKEVAYQMIQKFDPTKLEICRECIKEHPYDVSKVNKILTELGTYDIDAPPFSEKTIRFFLNDGDKSGSSLQLSSTLNSDKTISYWIQYHVEPYYVKIAMLKLMNIPITPENLSEIGQRYKALYHQAYIETKNITVKCEQLDPLYLKLIIESFISKNYKYKLL
jgi:hypothetical protein